ncbi:MAG: CCA tRNA nucleotidyltransferase [Planctomycetota bacterium]
MRQPNTEDLDPRLRRTACRVAQRLADAGFRAWLVGGAVRDLALERTPQEIDMVSDARPEQVEELFERSIPVGRAFGILLLIVEGCEIELATLRTEGNYSDARRPDEVFYGSSVEEDAARRDFTLNALYLDPLTDELSDPTGGLEDLRQGILRTVGDPEQRFAEDGLRLLRMARFQAALGLELAPGMEQAAQRSAHALRGVSVERVQHELARIFRGPRCTQALRTLDRARLLERALPDWARASAVPLASRLSALEALPSPPGELAGWAVLLESRPRGVLDERRVMEDVARARALRLSRRMLKALEKVWRLRRTVIPLARPGAPRSERVLALRDEGWELGLGLALAWAQVGSESTRELEHLRSWRAGLSLEVLRPEALIDATDLEHADIPRGPLWGRLLDETERLQLDGLLGSRGEALAWLARRAKVLET